MSKKLFLTFKNNFLENVDNDYIPKGKKDLNNKANGNSEQKKKM